MYIKKVIVYNYIPRLLYNMTHRKDIEYRI